MSQEAEQSLGERGFSMLGLRVVNHKVPRQHKKPWKQALLREKEPLDPSKKVWPAPLFTSAGAADYPGQFGKETGAGDGIKRVSWDSQPHMVRGRQGNKINAYKELQEAKSIPNHTRYWLWGWRPICSLNQYLLSILYRPGTVPGIGLSAGNRATNKPFPDFFSSSGERIGMTSGSHWPKDCAGLRPQEADISWGRKLRLGIAWSG